MAELPKTTIHEREKYQHQKYSLEDLQYVPGENAVYILEGKNRKYAEEDIFLLCDIFEAAGKLRSDVPKLRLYSDDIRYYADTALPPKLYTHLCLDLIQDYTLLLHFYITPDEKNILYGDIYYIGDGSIGKYNIVFEHENDIFYFTCRLHDGTLQLSQVLCDKGKRKKRFYPILYIGRQAAGLLSGAVLVLAAAIVLTFILDNTQKYEQGDGIEIIALATDSVSENLLKLQTDPAPETAFTEITHAQDAGTAESASKETVFETTDIPEAEAIPETAALPEIIKISENEEAGVRLLAITSPVSKGSTAAIKAQGLANTGYSIAVYYSSGKSSAKGLEDKISDQSGIVEWSWKVGAKTKAGTYKIEITGSGQTYPFEFTVTD